MNLIYSTTLKDNGHGVLKKAWYLPRAFRAVLYMSNYNYSKILSEGIPSHAHRIFDHYFDDRQDAFIIAVRPYGMDEGMHVMMAYVCSSKDLELCTSKA